MTEDGRWKTEDTLPFFLISVYRVPSSLKHLLSSPIWWTHIKDTYRHTNTIHNRIQIQYNTTIQYYSRQYNKTVYNTTRSQQDSTIVTLCNQGPLEQRTAQPPLYIHPFTHRNFPLYSQVTCDSGCFHLFIHFYPYQRFNCHVGGTLVFRQILL